jgi:hypothetical protein
MHRLFKRASNWASKNKTNSKKSTRTLRIEQVEARQLMTVSPPIGATAINHDLTVYGPVADIALAEGTISFDASNNVLTIDGSDAYADNVKVCINHRAGNGAGNLPDLLTVQLGNINSPLVRVFDPNSVRLIMFHGLGGNDIFNNLTSIDSYVLGGAGNDTLLGGRGDDSMWGEDNDDYIDGRAGSDMLLGGNGVDAIFGDAGDDNLYGGAGVDRLFGGNGVDRLFGESGIDFLYGGASSDSISDSQSQNKYADYGPDFFGPSASGFGAFDWFDKNLKDDSVRSLARLDYRDGVIDRNDMLGIYTLISTEGVQSSIPFIGTVSTNEFSDLKTLLSTKINFQTDTRFFADKVVNGDRANQRYHGAALGNLQANVSATRLNALVDKWFKGGDLPQIVDPSLGTLRYEKAEGSLFVNGASFTDVDQGTVSDCYFLSTLGEVAKHANSTIRNMFGDNGDGTWSVRFIISGQARYVTVNRMLPCLGHGFGASWAAGWGLDSSGFSKDISDPTNELWVALAEKAYVQMNESGVIRQDGNNNYAGIEFGYSSDAFAHLAGVTGTNHSDLSSATGMINSINAGKAITLATKSSGVDSRLTPNHSYMVIGYNPATQLFEVFNPHGFENSDGPNRATQSPIVHMNWQAIEENCVNWTDALL